VSHQNANVTCRLVENLLDEFNLKDLFLSIHRHVKCRASTAIETMRVIAATILLFVTVNAFGVADSKKVSGHFDPSVHIL
jgi:hypothetical protein